MNTRAPAGVDRTISRPTPSAAAARPVFDAVPVGTSGSDRTSGAGVAVGLGASVTAVSVNSRPAGVGGGGGTLAAGGGATVVVTSRLPTPYPAPNPSAMPTINARASGHMADRER